MNKIIQDMRYKQAVIEYSLKYGVTTAAICYKTTRQNIYRWRKQYDGTVRSLADRSHRVKYFPSACLVRKSAEEANENGGYFYQYT